MDKITNFTDLTVWQKAHDLVSVVYIITKEFPNSEIYGLTSQLRRAAVSVTANIAEGFSRYHYKDRARFYYDARGSLSEVQSELLDAKIVGLLSEENFVLAWGKSIEIHKLLNGLIKKTNSL